MKTELNDHVYRSDRMFEKIYKSSLSPEDFQKVTDDCLKRFKTIPMPSRGNERKYYSSFVRRLNAVKQSLLHLNLMEKSIYQRVLFETYDKPVAKGTGNDAPLQPDIVARVPPPSQDKANPVSWQDIELCAEVKDKYADMVAQGATYARSTFHAQGSRNFVLIIFFQYPTKQVSFGLFTSSWLCLTHKCDIRNVEGQQQFIRDMAQIWSCEQKWSAGFDMTRNNERCYLGKYGTYSLQSLSHRVSVRGRRTRVDLISANNHAQKVADDAAVELQEIDGMDQYTKSVEASPTSSKPSKESKKSARVASQTESKDKEPESSNSFRRSSRIVNKNPVSLQKLQGQTLTKKLNPSPLSTTPSTTSGPPAQSSSTQASLIRPCDFLVPDHPARHDKLILKDSWPIVSRERQEERVFKNIETKFGVPVILGSFVVTIQCSDNDEIPSDTIWLCPENAVWLPLWRLSKSRKSKKQSSSEDESSDDEEIDQEEEDEEVEKEEELEEDAEEMSEETPQEGEVYAEPKPEHRVHVRLLTLTEGDQLYKAESPRKLLLAILHAMIGYWEIFKNGWLHRDVSIGNCLIMKRPEKRDRIDGFASILTENIRSKYFEECTGFLIDGDLAVEWGNLDREISRQRSGTPPFMSCRLIQAIIADTHIVQSADDDLESFVWVLFWAILNIMKLRRAKFTRTEQDYLSCMQSRDMHILRGKSYFSQTLLQQKHTLEYEQKSKTLTGTHFYNIPSRGFKPFVTLLLEWTELAQTISSLPLTRPADDYPMFLKTHLEKYLIIGIKYLEELPDSWDYILKKTV